jgi:hypothetical protein
MLVAIYFSRKQDRPHGELSYRALIEHERLALALERDEPAYKTYAGQTSDGMQHRLDWLIAYDTEILRLTLTRLGEVSPATWKELRRFLDTVVNDALMKPTTLRPWGASLLYGAGLEGRVKEEELQLCVVEGLGLGEEVATMGDDTPYGRLWLIKERTWMPGGEAEKGQSEAFLDEVEAARFPWMRTCALLWPLDRAEKVKSMFLMPLEHGFTRIELYLHKCEHLIRQYYAIREMLLEARAGLESVSLATLRTLDFSEIQRERAELEAISRELMTFLAKKAQADLLLNSIRANFRNYSEHCLRLELDVEHYAWPYGLKQRRIGRDIEQMETDLRYCEAMLESARAIHEVQRVVEATRMERVSLLLSGAAIIIAGVAIYESFLDIWKLAIDGSGLTMPSPLVRVLLGFLLAVSFPLGGYWLFERRWLRTAICLLLGAITIALAAISTVYL